MMRHFFWCAQLLFSVRGATAALCPDGSAGLTKALYEGGDAAAYQDVTCIPKEEFKDYTGDVTLSGLPSLKSIGFAAFYEFDGKLTFTGEYPVLEIIDGYAFQSATNADSTIAFSGLQSLKSIGNEAFEDFGGKLTFTGEYPSYEGCTRVRHGVNPASDIVIYAPGQVPLTKALYEGGDAAAYQDVTCIPEEEFKDYTKDVTLNGLPSLKSIGGNAFASFRGKLTFTGEYPALETIDNGAFYNADNAESVITLNGLPSLKSIGEIAFKSFVGKLTISGEYPALETIDEEAFRSHGNANSIVAFDGLPSLKSIVQCAFLNFGGKLTFTGEYPALETIEQAAFKDASDASSVITFTKLQSLKSIGGYAFSLFGGKLTLTGDYPALETIGANAFQRAGNADSTITFNGLPSLKSIEKEAFDSFGGKLAFTGEYPALETIGGGAFQSARNVDSTIAFSSLQSLKSIWGDAFDNFGGELTIVGEYPNYEGCTRLSGINPDPDIVLHAPRQIPLTKTVYEEAANGDATEIANITCIPHGEFKDYTKDVALNGLQSLKSIGGYAFQTLKGKLTITGEYPALETIGDRAFRSATPVLTTTNSAITFTKLQSLKSIGHYAFSRFGGMLTITGEYPALETIGAGAFRYARNAKSVITFNGLPSLKSIGWQAFYSFFGKLTFTGECPALETIDQDAFKGAGNADSDVEITCSSPAGLTIHETAFNDFLGDHTRTNEFTHCVVTTTTATTTTTTTSLCIDGSVGLTQALYEGGDAAAYQDVTCIPDREFLHYQGNVALNGLQSLKSIGEQAFNSFGGKLTFTGEYPALATIGNGAFGSVSNATSVITFNGLPSLQSILNGAFIKFGGKLTFTGEYPALEAIGSAAFQCVGNAASTITITGLQSLENIGVQAFFNYSGKLTFTGEYPALESIDSNAFYSYGVNNVDSVITFNGLPSLKSIGERAFQSFNGTLTFTGEYPALETIALQAFYLAGNADSVVAIECSSPAGLTLGNDTFTHFNGTRNATSELKQCVVTTVTTTTTTTTTLLGQQIDPTTFAVATTSTPTPTSTTTAADLPNVSNANSSNGATIGGIVAGVLLAAAAIAAIVYYYRKRASAAAPAMHRAGNAAEIVEDELRRNTIGMEENPLAAACRAKAASANAHHDPTTTTTTVRTARSPRQPAKPDANTYVNVMYSNSPTAAAASEPDYATIDERDHAAAASKPDYATIDERDHAAAASKPEYVNIDENNYMVYLNAFAGGTTGDIYGELAALGQISSSGTHYATADESNAPVYATPAEAAGNGAAAAAPRRGSTVLYNKAAVYQLETARKQEDIERQLSHLTEAQKDEELLKKTKAMAAHKHKYDALFAKWSASAWIEDLDMEHKIVVRHIAVEFVVQPNPWAKLATKPGNTQGKAGDVTSKKYLLKLLEVYNQKEEDSPVPMIAAACRQIAAKLGGGAVRFVLGETKNQKRIFEKVKSRNGRFDLIRDYARATFVVKDVAAFPRLLKHMLLDETFDVVRVKNRLSRSWDSRASAGYRDYQVLVQTKDGWIMELQLVPKAMYTLKSKLGHSDYTRYRFIIEAGQRARGKATSDQDC